MSTHHVMLDLETLGTKPGCPILAIGAAVITNYREYPLQKITLLDVTINEGQARLNNPDPDTVDWWNRQEQEARDRLFNNPDSIYIVDALNHFNSFLLQLKNTPTDRIIIWGNGATFDEPIIKEAMIRYDIEPVWTFRDSMCFRTLKEIGKLLGIQEPEFAGTKHIALNDALHQAQWAQLIFDNIGIPI
jgi:exodeoxyribonuclease VIII